MTHRRVEACDSWRPPPAPAQAPALLLRAGGPWARSSSSPPGAFASLSVRDGGEAMVAKAEEEREVAAEGSGRKGKVPPVAQLLKHPLALLALVPSSVALFAAGAGAGAVAKTVTAPLDRVKILMQARLLIPMPHSRFILPTTWLMFLTRSSSVRSFLQTHSVRVAGESTKKGIQFLEVTMRYILSWLGSA
jgi:solute carrier family 25 phosphate transporter 23/24/25/41